MLLSEVYAVIDLYGQCVQVSITSSSGPLDNSLCTSNVTEKSFPIQSPGRPSLCESRGGRLFSLKGPHWVSGQVVQEANWKSCLMDD